MVLVSEEIVLYLISRNLGYILRDISNNIQYL